MKITLDFLKELLGDEEFRSIPVILATQNSARKPWWNALEELKSEGAKATIWEGCQWAALLFDTYGENIKKVSLSLNVEYDKNDSYMTCSVYINDEHCFDGDIELDEDVLVAVDAIDGNNALNHAVAEMDTMGNSTLLSELETFEEAFGSPFTSAQEARDIAKKYAPEINKWFVGKLLERQVKDQAIEREKAKNSGPKM